jgi:hypothetical protein
MWFAKAITQQQVVHAFAGGGIALRAFPEPGHHELQFTASTPQANPAVVVTVFPDERSAQKAPQTLAINGRRIKAIGTRNVRIWVAANAPHDLRRHVHVALRTLKRLG